MGPGHSFLPVLTAVCLPEDDCFKTPKQRNSQTFMPFQNFPSIREYQFSLPWRLLVLKNIFCKCIKTFYITLNMILSVKKELSCPFRGTTALAVSNNVIVTKWALQNRGYVKQFRSKVTNIVAIIMYVNSLAPRDPRTSVGIMMTKFLPLKLNGTGSGSVNSLRPSDAYIRR